LIMLVLALLLGVRHATHGLSKLATAAKAVTAGDIERPFRATGVGEVYSLGLAFEAMLANLRASMTQIRQLAYYDGVTGLPNRQKIRADAAKILQTSQSGALLFMDLDGFKAINDTFGHKYGDLLLKKVGERLTKFFDGALPDSVIVARVG